MLIGCAGLCLFLGCPLGGGGEDQTPLTGPAVTNIVIPRHDREGSSRKPAGDGTNIIEYLQEKFRIPAQPVPETPPGPDDVATPDGRVYRNVQVWKSEPDGLTIRHDEGLTKLEFPQLPEEWQNEYEYDPEMAAAYKRAVAAALKEAERNQRILREQLNADRAQPIPEEPR